MGNANCEKERDGAELTATPAERTTLQAMIALLGIREVVRLTGIPRSSIASAAGGLAMRLGTLTLLRSRLAALRSAEPAAMTEQR